MSLEINKPHRIFFANYAEVIKEQTGIQPPLEQKDVKTYLDSVLLEIQSKKENNKSIKRALDR
jgi:hypothetical protein